MKVCAWAPRFLVAAGCLLAASSLEAADIRALIQKAQEGDLELRRVVLAQEIARNGISRAAARRGLTLGVGTDSSEPVALSANFGSPFSLGVSATPEVSLTLPEPVSTTFTLGTPLSLSILPSTTFTPEVSLSASQPLTPLLGAGAEAKVRELEEALDLARAEEAVRTRKAEVAQRTISALRLLEELRLQISDLQQDLLDMADEEARAKALDPEAASSPSSRQAAERHRAADEALARARRALDLRKARVEQVLGVELGDVLEGFPTTVPAAPVGASNPAVRQAEAEVELAKARLERDRTTGLPSLTASASFGLSPAGRGVSAPLSLTFGVWWPVLDGGARAEDRKGLELALRDRMLGLQIAKTDLEADLLDLGLEAESLTDRLSAAQRAVEDAEADHQSVQALADAGIRSQRELERAAYTVDRKTAELRLLDYDLLSFEYRVAGQGIASSPQP